MDSKASAAIANDSLMALLRTRFSAEARRTSVVFAGGLLTLLAFSMIAVRVADGPRAFLDGIVARGTSVVVLFAALPTAFAMARVLGVAPVEPWILALAGLRGFHPRQVLDRVPSALFFVALMRVFLLLIPLVALSVLLSLPDIHTAARRIFAGTLFVALAMFCSGVLVVVAWLGARWFQRGRLALVLFIFLPAILTSMSHKLPRELSPWGAYSSMNEAVQRLAQN